MTQRERLTRLLDDPEHALADPDAAVRRIAAATAVPETDDVPRLVRMLGEDPDPAVRRECAETLGRSSDPPVAELQHALGDPAVVVREAAATALGEAGATQSVDPLVAVAADEEEDKLVREAAIAALGALGDERGRPVLLHLIEHGPPQLRRRCVPALSVFDGDDIEQALRRAATDRNPMVREAAEMVVGRPAAGS